MLSYALLFISAFGAATLLPLQSEAVLVALLAEGSHSVVGLLFFASLGKYFGFLCELVAGLSN